MRKPVELTFAELSQSVRSIQQRLKAVENGRDLKKGTVFLLFLTANFEIRTHCLFLATGVISLSQAGGSVLLHLPMSNALARKYRANDARHFDSIILPRFVSLSNCIVITIHTVHLYLKRRGGLATFLKHFFRLLAAASGKTQDG